MFELRKAHTDILKLAADRAEVRLTLTYSGRGMMGRSCAGILTDAPGGLFAFGAAFAYVLGSAIDAAAEAKSVDGEWSAALGQLADALAPGGELLGVRQDSMGHGYVFYWPGLATEAIAANGGVPV